MDPSAVYTLGIFDLDVHMVVSELTRQNESLAGLRLAKALVVRGVLGTQHND